jgi:hypothetical protein
MANQRPRLAASEIEAMLRAALQRLPTLHDTQSVTIRPYSGPKGWTWDLDRIEPEVDLRRLSLSAWRPSSVSYSNNTILTSALRRQPEDDKAAAQNLRRAF